jgi:carboxylate-amine ligase
MALLEYVRPVLEEQGEFSAVEFLLFQVLSRGTGAAVQRDSYVRGANTQDVVTDAVHITCLPVTRLQAATAVS